jgi:hypothetical protein
VEGKDEEGKKRKEDEWYLGQLNVKWVVFG